MFLSIKEDLFANNANNMTYTTTPPGPPAPPPTTKDTVALIIGGWYGIYGDSFTSTEIYPPVVGCSLPSLPEERSRHAGFVHNNAVTLCGGWVKASSLTKSCLVLDIENQRWEKNVIGDLTVYRYEHAAVSVENVGTYLIGGASENPGMNPTTTDFLASGLTQWTWGPRLPVSMHSPCVVRISQLSFLAIHGHNIREYQVDVANPTSSSGWQEANKWPTLQTYRGGLGCALTTNNKVVIAGGGSVYTYHKSSEVLDLATRKITNSGDMTSPRAYVHLATTTVGGETKIFAIGGKWRSSYALDSVEEFNPDDESWTLAPTTLAERKFNFGRLVVEVETICPT